MARCALMRAIALLTMHVVVGADEVHGNGTATHDSDGGSEMSIGAGLFGGLLSGVGIILFIAAKEQKEKNALLAGEDGVGIAQANVTSKKRTESVDEGQGVATFIYWIDYTFKGLHVKKDEGFEVTASDKIVHKETYDTLETPCVQPVRYLLKDPALCQLQIESDAAAKDGSLMLVLVLVPVGVGVAGFGAGFSGGSLTEVGIAALIYTLVVGAAVIEGLYKVCGKVCGACSCCQDNSVKIKTIPASAVPSGTVAVSNPM